MATTRIIPLHQNKGRTLAKNLEARISYAANPSKTENGQLISSYSCNPGLAVSEIALSKKEYSDITGRYQISDVIAYQVRQPFKPGKITSEEANRVGMNLQNASRKATMLLSSVHIPIKPTYTTT